MLTLAAFALGLIPGLAVAYLVSRNANEGLARADGALEREREHGRAERAELLLRAQHERSELITRCMDPSLVAALAPPPVDPDGQPMKLHVTEEDEIARQDAVAAIEAELEARDRVLS